jgi:hypothetical protein
MQRQIACTEAAICHHLFDPGKQYSRRWVRGEERQLIPEGEDAAANCLHSSSISPPSLSQGKKIYGVQIVRGEERQLTPAREDAAANCLHYSSNLPPCFEPGKKRFTQDSRVRGKGGEGSLPQRERMQRQTACRK